MCLVPHAVPLKSHSSIEESSLVTKSYSTERSALQVSVRPASTHSVRPSRAHRRGRLPQHVPQSDHHLGLAPLALRAGPFVEALDVRREQLAQVLLVRARLRLRLRVRVRVRVGVRVIESGLGLGSGLGLRSGSGLGLGVLLEGCEVRVELAAQRLVDRVGAEVDVGRGWTLGPPHQEDSTL